MPAKKDKLGKYGDKETKPENSFGIDSKLFNFIYVLITGCPSPVSDVMDVFDGGIIGVNTKGIGVWDCRPGVEFFGRLLFSGNIKLEEDYNDSGKYIRKFR